MAQCGEQILCRREKVGFAASPTHCSTHSTATNSAAHIGDERIQSLVVRVITFDFNSWVQGLVAPRRAKRSESAFPTSMAPKRRRGSSRDEEKDAVEVVDEQQEETQPSAAAGGRQRGAAAAAAAAPSGRRNATGRAEQAADIARRCACSVCTLRSAISLLQQGRRQQGAHANGRPWVPHHHHAPFSRVRKRPSSDLTARTPRQPLLAQARRPLCPVSGRGGRGGGRQRPHGRRQREAKGAAAWGGACGASGRAPCRLESARAFTHSDADTIAH